MTITGLAYSEAYLAANSGLGLTTAMLVADVIACTGSCSRTNNRFVYTAGSNWFDVEVDAGEALTLTFMFMDEGNGAPVTAKHQMLAVQGLDTTGFNNGQQTGRMCAQVDLLSPPTHVFYDFWNAHQPESAYYNIYRDPRQTAAGNQPSSHCTTSGASPVVTDAVKGYTRVWCDVDSIWNFESHQGSNCDNTNWNDPQALQMSVELIQYPWTQRQTNFPTLHGVDVDPADPNILKHMRFCGTQRRTGLCGGHSTGYPVDTDEVPLTDNYADPGGTNYEMPRIIYAPDVFINPQDGSKLSYKRQWGMHAVQFVWDTTFATGTGGAFSLDVGIADPDGGRQRQRARAAARRLGARRRQHRQRRAQPALLLQPDRPAGRVRAPAEPAAAAAARRRRRGDDVCRRRRPRCPARSSRPCLRCTGRSTRTSARASA